MKLFNAILSALAVLMLAGAAQAVPEQGNLLSEFSTPGAEVVAPMSSGELDGIRGEGTAVYEFVFDRLHHDINKTFVFGDTTITVVGVAATGQITVTIDSPHIP